MTYNVFATIVALGTMRNACRHEGFLLDPMEFQQRSQITLVWQSHGHIRRTFCEFCASPFSEENITELLDMESWRKWLGRYIMRWGNPIEIQGKMTGRRWIQHSMNARLVEIWKTGLTITTTPVQTAKHFCELYITSHELVNYCDTGSPLAVQTSVMSWNLSLSSVLWYRVSISSTNIRRVVESISLFCPRSAPRYEPTVPRTVFTWVWMGNHWDVTNNRRSERIQYIHPEGTCQSPVVELDHVPNLW